MDEVISEVARRPVMQTTVHHHTKLVFNPGRVIQQVELSMLLLSSIHDCICRMYCVLLTTVYRSQGQVYVKTVHCPQCMGLIVCTQ